MGQRNKRICCCSSIIKRKILKVFFQLCGMVDLDNKDIPESYLKTIEIEGYLKWIDFKIIWQVYQNSDIVVLPSIEKECQRFLLRLVRRSSS
jgi:hypothetical protein